MKLLTIAIPCYNSQEYMDKSIKKKLKALYELIIEEAENNEAFAEKLESIMMDDINFVSLGS